MQWEKVGQRENDFLKNYLFYEGLTDNFVQVWKMAHPHFLTIRKDMTYTHYINKDSSTKLAEFILEQTKKNPDFMKNMFEEGKKHFDSLMNFCYNFKGLRSKNNNQLLELINEYFKLYREPYPYFMLTVEAGPLEKEDTTSVGDTINFMAKLRFYGRAAFNKTHELAYPLFEEIANRFNVSVKELKFLKPSEIQCLLEGRDVKIAELIKERENCFFIHKDGKFELYENASLVIYDANDNKYRSGELKGQGTFPAFYKGKVKLVRGLGDIKNLKGGEVIVLKMTTTDLVVAGLEKAGAIVTDEGGITCHAAIISREFKIPCVIGTNIATKVLKDGDFVDVNADKGIVKIIERKR